MFKNAFTSGCDKFKADTIDKHTRMEDHKYAVGAESEHGDIQNVAIKAAEKEQDAVEGLRACLQVARLTRHSGPATALSLSTLACIS